MRLKVGAFFFRKSKFLAGSNIYITEDFSKRVKDRRIELQKFMKKLKKRYLSFLLILNKFEVVVTTQKTLFPWPIRVKMCKFERITNYLYCLAKSYQLAIRRRPLSKFILRYDKLIVDKDVFSFNESTGTVELSSSRSVAEESDYHSASSPTTPHR